MPLFGDATPADITHSHYVAATANGHRTVTAHDVQETLNNPDYARMLVHPYSLTAVPSAHSGVPTTVFTPTSVAAEYPFVLRDMHGGGLGYRYRTVPEALLAIVSQYLPSPTATRIHPADTHNNYYVDLDNFPDAPLPWSRSVHRINRETTPTHAPPFTPHLNYRTGPELLLIDPDRADAPAYRVQAADSLDAKLAPRHRIISGDILRSHLRFAVKHNGEAAMEGPEQTDGTIVYRHDGHDHTGTSGLVIAYPPCATCGFGPGHRPFRNPTWTRRCLNCQHTAD
ncbi:hypothetical protein [Streptomyces sp. NPDC048272]|uniref:hypothetical protein n=1 Tax=Streptomyces sp. NPDC048272 TaxID=3154616 RepID=UPI003414D58D